MSVKNTIVWTDIPVTKVARAVKFYSAVLGAKATRESMSGMEFGLLPHRKNSVSGCLVKMVGYKPSKTGPLLYFNVDGRHDTAEKTAKKNGGKILKKKHQIGPHGFRTVLVDSEGNRIALHSSKG